MTLYVTDAQLNGYRPGSSEDKPDYTIAGNDIHSFDVESKAGDLKDTAKLAIDNYQDEYAGEIEHGDKLGLVITAIGVEGGVSKYGEGGFGEGPYGGAGNEFRWTGLLRNIHRAYQGASLSTIQLDAEDFVSGIMSLRRVYNNFRTRQIVGTNGIINEILEDECPEIDRSLLPDEPGTTSITLNGLYVLEAVGELALRLPAVMSPVGDALRFETPAALSPSFTLESADYGVADFGSQDENMRTLVRVRGGTDHAVDDEQLTQDGTQTVTDTSRLTHQLDTRKSFISQLDLYTVADRTGADIIIRLQKNEGGVPVAIDDDTSDIASKRLSAEFLDDDGFTLFIMPTQPENVLPEPNPWLIIECEDSSGQDIGIDSATGIPAYQAFYPYPIVIEKSSLGSSAQYRHRDGAVADRTIASFDEARARADSFLSEHATPEETLQLDAQSERMHALEVGEVVQANMSHMEGAFVCIEKKMHFETNQLNTTMSFQSLESI